MKKVILSMLPILCLLISGCQEATDADISPQEKPANSYEEAVVPVE